VLAQVDADRFGMQVSAFAAAPSGRGDHAFLARLGEAVLPGPGTVLQEGDVLHVIALESDLERIEAIFASRTPGGRPAGKGSS